MADPKVRYSRPPRNDLTAEYVRSILDYDPETGLFTWKPRPSQGKRWNTRYAGKQAGWNRGQGYIAITIDSYDYMAHRVAWLIMTDEWPTHEVDHRLGKRGDNRWSELRHADNQQQAQNAKLRKDNTSGFKGVSWFQGKWGSHIRHEGKLIHLGYFDTAPEAGAAYAEAAIRLYGEFARTK